jgi:AraC-like DNA-binding protein
MKSKSSKPSNDGGNTEVPVDESTLLGQILVELGYITIYQLDEALHIQRTDKEGGKEHKPLGQILLELGYCGPNHLIRAIQVQCEYRNASPAKQ